MQASQGCRFIIVVTLPSGTKYAVGSVNGNMAFVQVPEDGRLNNVLAWASTEDVYKWMNLFREKNGEEAWKKFTGLKPDIGQVRMAQ